MPSIFKPASVEPVDLRARIGIVACAVLLALMTAVAISRAVAAKATPPVHAVKIENMKFSPAALTVFVGDRIEFKNDDLVPHTATAKPSTAFDSGLVMPGESWVLIAKSAGRFSYTCTFHPMMIGEIIVEKRR